MAYDARLRPYTDRLAHLLADARGTAVLAELQRLAAEQRTGTRQQPDGPAADRVGVWQAERGAGGVALRRPALPAHKLVGWADVDHVPPAGDARRVVLIGESSARGLDSTSVLARMLEMAAPGGYQCVNLMRTGGHVEQLIRLAGQLPLAHPDVVVLVAGNDWTAPPVSFPAAVRHKLVDAWRTGAYPAIRRTYIDEVVLPRARRLLDQLATLDADGGTKVVVMIPEFNLPGWTPPADVEVPALPADALRRWYDLYDEALAACAERRWPDVERAVDRQRLLDNGTSPIPGYLLASAAMAQGDGTATRAALEDSRDALVGIGVWHTPRMLRDIQELLAGFAADHDFPVVDVRSVLDSEHLPGMPDPAYLYSYCHLSDIGMEKAMAAIADAILDRPLGSTPHGHRVEPSVRGAAHLTAAVFGALFGNTADRILPLLRAAIDADPHTATTSLTALLDVLEGAGPMWCHAAVATLAASPLVHTLFGPPMMKSDHPPELWTLRACLGEVLQRTPGTVTADVDLLASPDGAGHRPANLTAKRGYRQATTRTQTLAFALDRPRHGRLLVTYRMPHAAADTTARVSLNEQPVGTLAASKAWSGSELALRRECTRAGVNHVAVRWPVPEIDQHRWRDAEAEAIGRGAMQVLPVFGELFEARVTLGDGGSR